MFGNLVNRPDIRRIGRALRLGRLARGAAALWMRGDRVECLCCGGRFRGFLPGGPERRPDARCPHCGSLERHRLVWIWLQHRTDLLTARRRVLVVAPDVFLQDALRARPSLDYLSIDLESPLAMRHMDLTRLELPDASFDAAFCSHVLEHILDDRTAMRELLRVLAPGGWAVLQTPLDPARERTLEDPTLTAPADRLRVFGQADHVRIYGRDFFDRLRECGWAIERVPLARTLGEAVTRRHGLDPDEDVIVGRRAAQG
jgi:SAM-dependent methyltransferase